jgi:hypothetical protein
MSNATTGLGSVMDRIVFAAIAFLIPVIAPALLYVVLTAFGISPAFSVGYGFSFTTSTTGTGMVSLWAGGLSLPAGFLTLMNDALYIFSLVVGLLLIISATRSMLETRREMS